MYIYVYIYIIYIYMYVIMYVCMCIYIYIYYNRYRVIYIINNVFIIQLYTSCDNCILIYSDCTQTAVF